ncbi:MAG: site-specific DNA-methyltransferase [Spirochaetales bacterium]|nr:site-specific DNA-methyltransferase [Spirochaetales bacterium]
MKSFMNLRNTSLKILPEQFGGADERFEEEIAELLINEYTVPDDRVIDVFAGFGTTLSVAERMDRLPYGIEADPERFEYARDRIRHRENVIHGDTRLLDRYPLPRMDFALCSPVYMNRKWNRDPLTHDTTAQTYSGYLDELRMIFTKLGNLVKEGAYIVIEAANFKSVIRESGSESVITTTFAWDLCREVSKVLCFEHEIVICGKGADSGKTANGYCYDHSYCLVFRNLPAG